MGKLVLPAAILASVLCCCSLFEPRSPEDPEEPPVEWFDPYQYQTVITNLKNTMEGLSVPYYMRCYSDSFAFIADDQDTAQYGWNFRNWDYVTEESAVGLIFDEAQSDTTYGQDSVSSVVFSEIPSLPDPVDYEDTIDIYREYEIQYLPSEHSPAKGIARLYLARPGSGGLWSIYRWEDSRREEHGPDDVTWGVFKGYYLFTLSSR